MSAFLFLLLMMLAARQSSSSSSSSTPIAAQAAHAQVDATVKSAEAKGSTDPKKHKDAAAAQRRADALTKAAQQQAVAKTVPPPWPQAIPPGLPPFPGGWTPDNPPPTAVQNRAWQLLPTLWKTGPKTRKTEQTQGRWITYVAEPMAGGKKGVVAYRQKPGREGQPARQPTALPGPVSNAAYAPTSTQPMLRQGSSGPDVVRWQQIIGVTADGKFGPATAAATRTWQQQHGLAADGIVGPASWGASGVAA